jgi:hypothetical protein
MTTDSHPHEIVERRLAVSLGAFTARNALRTFSMRALGKTPEDVGLDEMPQLLSALRPMLRTLVGATQAERLLQYIRLDLGI